VVGPEARPVIAQVHHFLVTAKSSPSDAFHDAAVHHDLPSSAVVVGH
jgi:hypothetical protein